MKCSALIALSLVACASTDPHSDAAHGRKVMALQEKFDRFDYDANGKISREEIRTGMVEAGVAGVSQEDLDMAMKHYDVNKDGAISRWETQRAIDMPLPDHD